MCGYCGKILWVDLDAGSFKVENVSDHVYRQVLGGYGLGVKILLEKQPQGIDPLGPDNILGFLPGLLTGTGAFFSSRYMVVGKSPLTGGWGDANSGGSFSPEIKKCGFDGIFIRGAAAEPVYLYVTGDKVEIRDAGHLWGLDTVQTEERLAVELGSGIKVASIGPAGENLALIAGIINDKGRAAARSGLGAVMGSKKLKAIVLNGSHKIPVIDLKGLKHINKLIAAPIRKEASRLERVVSEAAQQWALPPLLRRGYNFKPTVKMIVSSLKKYGTGAVTAVAVESGDAPVKNWNGIGLLDFPWKRSCKISDRKTAKYFIKRFHCANCPLGCGAYVSVKGSKYQTKEAHRPEYETAAVFGSNLLIDSYEAIIKINDRCNRLGLDTISTGSCVAFAVECFEKGLIGHGDTGGFKLSWGDPEGVLQVIEDIAFRRGLGNVLADGVARAAQSIGGGSEDFAIHAGGQELPMHDPRFQPSYGLTYVVDATPGRHTAGANNYVDLGASPLFGAYKLNKVKKYDYHGKGKLQAFFSKQFQVLNCLGLCNFSGFLGPLPYGDMIRAAAGWEVSDDELLDIGERVLTLRQLFNLREGVLPMGFSLPDRVLGKPPLKTGPTSEVTIDLETMRLDYYKALGWNVKGMPDKRRCEQLNIEVD
ncbi:MAG: aldehyde ferredoxin oxidoreductase family protein [Bacillota bacterium]